MSIRLSTVALLLFAALSLAAAKTKPQIVTSKDGVMGYKDTPIQPWSGYHVHDPDRPVPPKVDPGPASAPAAAPSDAIVLFNGANLDAWQPTEWKLENNLLVAGKGPMATKQEFGSCQIHLEWRQPVETGDNVMNQGNNGVFLAGLYEIQIFDSYRVKLYPDGQAGAIYAQTPPFVNAMRPPGQWEVYDILFTAPKFEGDKLVANPRVTMFHNGVLVHLNQEVYGATGHRGLPRTDKMKPTGSLSFGAHGCPIQFRNIWLRPLAAAPTAK